MSTLLDVVAREGAFLVVVLALGLGPAAFLSGRVDSVGRWALAPALGLCLGVGVTVTLVQWEPVHGTYWVVPLLAVMSVAVASWRVARHGISWRVPRRELLGIVIVLVAVAAPASSALVSQHTVGPVTWNVYDAVGYVSEIDGQQTQSVNAASSTQPPYHNPNQHLWDFYAATDQNLDASALEGSVNDLLGLYATDTQSPFLIAILLIGGLGAFAAVRYFSASRTWSAVLAGVLFGGPFFLQLWGDSSQAAVCGLALLLPFVVVGSEAMRGRVTDAVLLGLIAAGLVTVYPLFVPAVAVASALILGGALLWTWRQGDATRLGLGAIAGRIAIVIALAGVLSPVAMARDLRYWRAVLDGAQSFAGLPPYHLPIGVLPGWLLQTRQFYTLPPLGVGGVKEFVLAVLLPVLFIGVIVVGLRRAPRAMIILPLLAVSALLAEYVFVKNACEYCVQRNLLPVAPYLILALSLGIAAIAASGWRGGRVLAGVLAGVVVAAVAERVRAERVYILDTAYFLDNANRVVLSHLPRPDVPVTVEGYGEEARSPGELPLVTALVNERTGGRVSVALSGDFAQNAYIGVPDQPALLEPDYRFVLTRFAGVHTGRRTIARSGGIALQERGPGPDVIAVGGLGAAIGRLNPAGVAWVQTSVLQEPLQLIVVGAPRDAPVWVRLVLQESQPVIIPRRRGVSSTQIGGRTVVCVRASASAAQTRPVSVAVDFGPVAPPPLHATYQFPTMPSVGVRLTSMLVQTSPCRP